MNSELRIQASNSDERNSIHRDRSLKFIIHRERGDKFLIIKVTSSLTCFQLQTVDNYK